MDTYQMTEKGLAELSPEQIRQMQRLLQMVGGSLDLGPGSPSLGLDEESDYCAWVDAIASTIISTEEEAKELLGKGFLHVYREVERGMHREKCRGAQGINVDFRHKLRACSRAEEKDRRRTLVATAPSRLARATVEEISGAMSHCQYPTDAKGSDDKALLPTLMIHRCGKILTDGHKYMDFLSMLGDLKTVADSWVSVLPTLEVARLWYFRMECERSLNQFADAHQSLSMMEDTLKSASGKVKEKMRPLQKRARELLEAEGEKENNEYPRDATAPKPIKISPPNPAFPALDSRLDVKMVPRRGKMTAKKMYSPGWGVVAAEPILCGEIIALEDRPILHRSTVAEKTSHCHYCLENTSFLLPCRGCSAVMFCSVKCLQAARDSYHSYECGAGLTALGRQEGSFTVDKVLLPTLRMVLSHPVSYFKENKEKFQYLSDKRRSPESFTEELPYLSNDQERFWDLLHKSDYDSSFYAKHFISGCLNPGGLFVMTKHVLEILETLKYNILKEDKDLMVSVILHVLGISRYNSKLLEVPNRAVIEKPESIFKGLVSSTESKLGYTELGTGVFATLSLFNHSCVPNCEVMPLGGKMAVLAQRPIKPGEELMVSYVRHFAQRYIRQLPGEHSFQCDCLGCTRKWGEPTRQTPTEDLVRKLRSISNPIFFGDIEVEQEKILRKELEQALGPKRVYVHKLQRQLGKEDFIQATSFGESIFKEYLTYHHWSRLTWDVEEEVKRVEGKSKKNKRGK